mmetsp:Transcript_97737/g.174118  ORF Transcript_97737/g.174118 Transcript_97737/m.174118 type:complete len:312 (+) Transcript_97737:57-992(+)
MGRGALSCCASEPLLQDPDGKSHSVITQEHGKKVPGRPPPISTNVKRVSLTDQNQTGTNRSSSPQGSPGTPLRKDKNKKAAPAAPTAKEAKSPVSKGSQAKRSNSRQLPEAREEAGGADGSAAQKSSAASEGKGATSSAEVEDGKPTAPPKELLLENQPEPDSPVSPTTPTQGSSGKSERAKRRRSQSDGKAKLPSGPVEPPCLGGPWSEPKFVAAPVAEQNLDGEWQLTSMEYVMLRPLPYEPVPWDRGDNNQQRTFIYKGALLQVPLLPLDQIESGKNRPKEDANAKQGKGWKVVKSKVVGGAMKANNP